MEIQEFRYPDPDPEYAESQQWDNVYSVVRIQEPEGISEGVETWRTRYIVNAHEPAISFMVYTDEIDQYIEIFNWIKQRESVNNE